MNAYDQLNQITNPASNDDPYDALSQITQTPKDVQTAEKYTNQQVDQGYCEQFASQVTDGKNWGSNAANAFQNQVQAGVGVADPTLKGIVPGDKVYFAPDASNGYNGHVGILVNNKGDFISADYDKVAINNLSSWPQQPIGYAQVGLPPIGGTQ